mmetsp:Transcript_18874/g.33524  ORF Transcript_18874/g.33524 Transcript_18874/m.33524 type:complete len:99 (-) Transcript_18874:263-559(-)
MSSESTKGTSFHFISSSPRKKEKRVMLPATFYIPRCLTAPGKQAHHQPLFAQSQKNHSLSIIPSLPSDSAETETQNKNNRYRDNNSKNKSCRSTGVFW